MHPYINKQVEEWREEFLREFFEPTFIDLRPYDYSEKDVAKIDWWLAKLTSAYEKGKEESTKETMQSLKKEWLYRRRLYKKSELRDVVDNLVGGIGSDITKE